MRVRAFVPVQEALHVDDIADLQRFNGLVHVGVFIAEIGFYGKGVFRTVLGDLEVQVIPLFAAAVILVKEGRAAFIGGFYGKALEFHKAVHVLLERTNRICFRKSGGHIHRLKEMRFALHRFKRGIDQLDFAGPFRLVSGHADLHAGRQQIVIIVLGAFHFIQEVSAVLALGIEGAFAIPPALLVDDKGVHRDLRVHFRIQEILVAADLGGCDARHVGIRAFVPVQEAIDVDHIANIQGFDGLVNIGIGTAEVGFHGHGDLFAAFCGLYGKVQVIALLAAAVIVVKERGTIFLR